MRHQRGAAGVTPSATVTEEPPQPGKNAARAVSRQCTGDDVRGYGTHAIPPSAVVLLLPGSGAESSPTTCNYRKTVTAWQCWDLQDAELTTAYTRESLEAGREPGDEPAGSYAALGRIVKGCEKGDRAGGRTVGGRPGAGVLETGGAQLSALRRLSAACAGAASQPRCWPVTRHHQGWRLPPATALLPTPTGGRSGEPAQPAADAGSQVYRLASAPGVAALTGCRSHRLPRRTSACRRARRDGRLTIVCYAPSRLAWWMPWRGGTCAPRVPGRRFSP